MGEILRKDYPDKKVRIMFEDEAGFGRINKAKYCWCTKYIRPQVPCHHIREYRYVYVAVESLTGENFFISNAILQYRKYECIFREAIKTI